MFFENKISSKRYLLFQKIPAAFKIFLIHNFKPLQNNMSKIIFLNLNCLSKLDKLYTYSNSNINYNSV